MCHQDQIDAAVKQLLALKAEYKQVTGQEYKPGAAPVQKAPAPVQNSPSPASAATGLSERVAEQGEVVRKLKAGKASKVRPHNHLLLVPVFILLSSPGTLPAMIKWSSSCWLFLRIRSMLQ